MRILEWQILEPLFLVNMRFLSNCLITHYDFPSKQQSKANIEIWMLEIINGIEKDSMHINEYS